MAQEIEQYEEHGRSVAHVSPSDVLSRVLAAATDPSIDAGKMREMATLAMEMQKHQLEIDKIGRQEQFNRDLNAAIDEMPVITKTGRILIPGKGGEPDRVQGTYARFEDLNRIVKPILSKNNLTISFTPGPRPGAQGGVAVAPVIRHANGIVKEYEPLPLPIENSGSKNDVQGIGSSISYGKRYAMCAVLNITVEAEDDDGSGGGVTMPDERANLVIEEATAAFDDGVYADWFRAQSPKDRAWLVRTGKHSEFGGLAIAGPVHKDPPPVHNSGAPVQDAGLDKGQPRKSALEGRVEQYEADVRACEDLDALVALQADRQQWADQVKSKRPDLHARIIEANTGRYSELAKSDPGPDFPDTGEPTDTLFPE